VVGWRNMKIGVVKEIKPDEYRVALTPAGAHELVARGHEVVVEHDAGEGSAFADAEYIAAGASLGDVDHVWGDADLVLKVKEPLPVEYARIRRGQILFTYLHLAPAPELTRALIDSGAICIAYETVETDDRRLPLLAPMSEVAGRLAPQMGAHALERPQGGRGMLLGGVAGVAPAKVVVLGGGIVGYNAALIAVGMQADVWILDRSIDRMRELDPMLDGRATIVMSTKLEVERALEDADLVIGAVLVPGARAPKLVTREMLGLMRPGAVLVDVAIDQGGCFETSHPTTHSDPTYVVDGVVHYCVANMPGAVPISSTRALTNATLPYLELLADRGFERAIGVAPALARGVSVVDGQVTSQPVAEALGIPFVPLADLVGQAA
jgi:alanine dehydrogenase